MRFRSMLAAAAALSFAFAGAACEPRDDQWETEPAVEPAPLPADTVTDPFDQPIAEDTFPFAPEDTLYPPEP